MLNRDFGSILSVFPRRKSKTQSSLNFLQSGTQNFTKSDFLGLAPIRRVMILAAQVLAIPGPRFLELCDSRFANLLAAPYCAIPRDYLSDTPQLRAMGFLVSPHGQLGAIPPPPFLSVSPWSTCEVEVRYPPLKRVSQRYLRDTL